MDNNKNIPNPMMIIPPIWFSPSINSPVDVASVLLIITPNVENTIENPITKNTEFNTMFVLLIVIILEPFFWFNSESVVPEIYAMNAGIIGNMQGAINDPSPASTATARVTSATH